MKPPMNGWKPWTTQYMTMYDMTRVTANGYFDAEDSEQARFEKRKAFFEEYLK